jgi:nitrogen regulatory protein P-II 1
MKKIEAYIHHRYLPRVVNSLEEMQHFPGFSVLEVLGHGHGTEAEGSYIQTEQNLTVHRRTLIQVVSADTLVEEIVERIRAASHTGNVGDGIIVVTPVDDAFRIRTGKSLSPSDATSNPADNS